MRHSCSQKIYEAWGKITSCATNFLITVLGQ
jgi:hypothetical protein